MTAGEFNGFVNEYSDDVYRFILKQIQSEDEAGDILQDAFERLWLNRHEVQKTKIKSWLFTTGYRLMIDRIRKIKREELGASQVAYEKMTVTSNFDVHSVIEKAFKTLPEIQKTVILLRDYEGYNYEEIGDITGLNTSQVKVYIYRGRMALKKYLIKPELII